MRIKFKLNAHKLYSYRINARKNQCSLIESVPTPLVHFTFHTTVHQRRLPPAPPSTNSSTLHLTIRSLIRTASILIHIKEINAIGKLNDFPAHPVPYRTIRAAPVLFLIIRTALTILRVSTFIMRFLLVGTLV
jgi:hypothetical protein